METLQLPDFALADDLELERYLPSLDGRWSAQTKAILSVLGTERLELNGNWARTPIDWRCPVCRRLKPEIARLTAAGVALCQLERHHDHLGDQGARILWRGQVRPENRSGAEALHSAIQVCMGLAERFHPILVCSDCNAADAAAKAALEYAADDHFSFSPSEIARFIKIEPNRPHEIDATIALGIWMAVAEDVRDRLAFMEVMARRIASGRHVREGSGYGPDHRAVLLTDIVGAAADDRWAAQRLETLVQKRSIKRDGFASSVKVPPRKRVALPSLGDLERFTASARRSDFWHEPPQDWCCASCDRTRFQILRKAPKSGLWTAGAHRRRVFAVEPRPDALWARNGWYDHGITFGDHHIVWMCKDCRQIITDAKQTGQNLTDDCLSVADVRSLLTAIFPHERPDYDRQAAARMARDNFEIMAAIDDYDRHRKRCLYLFLNRRQMLRFESEAVVDASLLDAVWEDHISIEHRPAHLHWLVEEGRRYAGADRQFAQERQTPE